MLKKMLLVLSFFMFLSTSLFAEQTDQRNAITIRPLDAVLGTANLTYIGKVTDFLAITVPQKIGYFWPLSPAISYVGSKDGGPAGTLTMTRAPLSFGGGVGARFYPSAKGLSSGWFIEPRATIDYFQAGAELSGGSQTITVVGYNFSATPSLKAGYDWYAKSGFTASLGIGAGYSFYIIQNLIPSGLSSSAALASDYLVASTTPRIGMFAGELDFAVGYSW